MTQSFKLRKILPKYIACDYTYHLVNEQMIYDSKGLFKDALSLMSILIITATLQS